MGKVRRAILKLSGELFGNEENHISFEKYNEVARQLVEIQKKTKIQGRAVKHWYLRYKFFSRAFIL